AKRELLVMDSATEMKNLRLAEKLWGELPLQRCIDVPLVFRILGVGQPHSNEEQILPIPKGIVPQGFRQAQDAASIQSSHIDNGFHREKIWRLLIADCWNTGLRRQLFRISAGASILAAVDDDTF